MSMIDDKRLKGNYAENQVAAWLSSHCLIRPVAEGTDIGIDLYCESVINSQPHMHFWIQVKAVNEKHLLEDGEDEKAWYDFKIKHLNYWSTQPIPVYAFLFPISEWPPNKPEKIFVIRISEFIVKNKIKDSGTLRLKSDGFFEVDNIDEELIDFINNIVPWDSSAILVKRGIIAPIQYPFDTKYAHFPRGIGFRHLEKTINNIRDASVMGLIDSLAYERIDLNKKILRKQFEEVLKVFEGQLHNHVLGLSILIRAAHDDGRINDAIKLIQDATARIHSDNSISSCEKKLSLQKLRVLLEDFKDYEDPP